MQQDVTKGGAKIIELRGRSSFQSPSYLSVEMIRSAMGGEAFRWPAGTFVNNEKYKCIMMAMKTTLDATGCHFEVPTGPSAGCVPAKGRRLFRKIFFPYGLFSTLLFRTGIIRRRLPLPLTEKVEFHSSLVFNSRFLAPA